MIIDCSTWKNRQRARRRQASYVFVDGVEIHKVVYLDTEAGIVKSLDVRGDGVVWAAYTMPAEERQKIPGWNEADLDGVLYKIVRGKVTLTPRHFRWRWHGKAKRRPS